MSTGRAHVAHSHARLSELADEELMGLVCHNEAAAFEVMLERHVDAAFSLACRMIGRPSLADEVTREALLSIWRSGDRYDRTRGSVRNWILAITRYRAVDALRSHGLRGPTGVGEGDLEEHVQAPAREDLKVVDRDEDQEIQMAFERLPTEQVRVIELAYFAGFTNTEIAAMLDLPIATVNDRMRLGLEKVRSRLDPPEAVT
jgi:RNA polymerase sigma-70 factor, ECF subfamily